MQTLQPNSLLQGGKYKILKVLGQGGFGVTYLAENVMLDGKVAIKEFFFKEYCNRNKETSHVTIPTDGSREIVERFKMKFIKEARTIFRLNHPNIVGIHDIFEENSTAYYVMDYIEGETLGDMVKRRGAIPEAEAITYIKEVGKALSYIHSRMMTHLDIKPGNIMKRKEDGKILLIDFGVAKQYDVVTEKGTTTTPVGISAGYSPSEQYKKNGVGDFSPQSDVYALAATMFKLLTGETPLEAIEVIDNGLPVDKLQAKGVSMPVIRAIEDAMQTRNKRTQSVDAFIARIDCKDYNIGPTIFKETDDEATRLTMDSPRNKARIQRKAANPDVLITNKSEAGQNHSKKEEPFNRIAEFAKKNICSTRMRVGMIVAIVVAVLGIVIAIARKPSEASIVASYSNGMLRVNNVEYKMIPVAGGTFTMGATSEQGSDTWDDEKPTHQVKLSSYYIGETEVTQALWQAVMGSNPSYYEGSNLPVENVSWNDCQEFITKLNAMTGQKFRLPTEAEWEFAARGGNNSKGYKYSGSNNIDDVAWYYGNSGSNTHAVKTKQPNELGIYDMSGNVWEWCSDWYGDYSSNARTNPTGPSTGSFRVYRGGSWSDHARSCRVSTRGSDSPDYRDCDLGLRLAL